MITVEKGHFQSHGPFHESLFRTYLHFAVLSGISIIGNDNGDASSTSSSESGYHEKQFHQIVIDGRTRWLNDIDIFSSNIFFNHHIDFPIGKSSHRRLPQGNSQMTSHFQGQRHVSIARENFYPTTVSFGLLSRFFQTSFRFRHFHGKLERSHKIGTIIVR